MSATESRHSAPSDQSKSTVALQEELATLLAKVERMQKVEAGSIHNRYVALFGAKNLRLLSLAIEATELHICCGEAEKAIAEKSGRPFADIAAEASARVAPMRERMLLKQKEYLDREARSLSAAPTEIAESEIFADVAREYSGGESGLQPDNATRRRLESRISAVRAELEESLLSYPFTMESRLRDHRWVAAELSRLDMEIGRLLTQIADLKATWRGYERGLTTGSAPDGVVSGV